MSTHTNAQTTGGLKERAPFIDPRPSPQPGQRDTLPGRVEWVKVQNEWTLAAAATPRPTMQEAVDAHNAGQAAVRNPSFDEVNHRLVPRMSEGITLSEDPIVVTLPYFPMQQTPNQRLATHNEEILAAVAEVRRLQAAIDKQNAEWEAMETERKRLEAQPALYSDLTKAKEALLAIACKKAD